MKVYRENETIYFSKDGIEKLGYTNYTPELWDIISKVTWTVKNDAMGTPKYIKSNQLKKTLHQVVIDYYFSEEVRKDAYSKEFIIEHLDNEGFNCKISNLYFLKKLTNTYKGWYFDKKSQESIPIVSVKMFHIIETQRFQITAAFNYPFTNPETGNILSVIKLLYDTPYGIVFQDAETLLNSILDIMKLDVIELRKILRFKDIKIEEYEHIQPSGDNITLKSGNCVIKDGKAYIIQEFDDNMELISSAYEKDWA